MRRRSGHVVMHSGQPSAWLVRAAESYGFTQEDLVRYYEALNTWPTDDVMRAAFIKRGVRQLIGGG